MDAMTIVVIILFAGFVVGGIALNIASEKASDKFDNENK